MVLIFIMIFIFSIITMICCIQADSYNDNIWVALLMNLFIFLISLIGMICIINSENDKEPKITNIPKNTKDSIIVKDSLLILNMNDTVKVLNINKI